jgi:hypothetical protein
VKIKSNSKRERNDANHIVDIIEDAVYLEDVSEVDGAMEEKKNCC